MRFFFSIALFFFCISSYAQIMMRVIDSLTKDELFLRQEEINKLAEIDWNDFYYKSNKSIYGTINDSDFIKILYTSKNEGVVFREFRVRNGSLDSIKIVFGKGYPLDSLSEDIHVNIFKILTNSLKSIQLADYSIVMGIWFIKKTWSDGLPFVESDTSGGEFTIYGYTPTIFLNEPFEFRTPTSLDSAFEIIDEYMGSKSNQVAFQVFGLDYYLSCFDKESRLFQEINTNWIEPKTLNLSEYEKSNKSLNDEEATKLLLKLYYHHLTEK